MRRYICRADRSLTVDKELSLCIRGFITTNWDRFYTTFRHLIYLTTLGIRFQCLLALKNLEFRTYYSSVQFTSATITIALIFSGFTYCLTAQKQTDQKVMKYHQQIVHEKISKKRTALEKILFII